MFAANTYVIRRATDTDTDALRELAALDSGPAPTGQILIGEIDGRPAAAVSIDDGRLVADPFQRTASLRSILRLRANALRSAERTPSVMDRLRAGVRVHRPEAWPMAA